MMLTLTFLVQSCRVAAVLEGAAVSGGRREIAHDGAVSPCAPDVALLAAWYKLFQANELRYELALCRCPPPFYLIAILVWVVNPVWRRYRLVFRRNWLVDDFPRYRNAYRSVSREAFFFRVFFREIAVIRCYTILFFTHV